MRIHDAACGFSDWDGLLDLIQSAFAFMEARIDPPSSAQGLTADSLREKASSESLFLAFDEVLLPRPDYRNRFSESLMRGINALERPLSSDRTHGALAGCVFCKPEPGHSLYIGKLAVRPGLQGRGVGRRLVDAAATAARAQGLRDLRLQTRIELQDNHRAFEAMGFVRTAEGRHPGFDRTTFIEMRKTL